jgi:hypothetical protein
MSFQGSARYQSLNRTKEQNTRRVDQEMRRNKTKNETNFIDFIHCWSNVSANAKSNFFKSATGEFIAGSGLRGKEQWSEVERWKKPTGHGRENNENAPKKRLTKCRASYQTYRFYSFLHLIEKDRRVRWGSRRNKQQDNKGEKKNRPEFKPPAQIRWRLVAAVPNWNSKIVKEERVRAISTKQGKPIKFRASERVVRL